MASAKFLCRPPAAAFRRSRVANAASSKRSKKGRVVADDILKRRTRSDRCFEQDGILRCASDGLHVPVLLGEVLEAFSCLSLQSFVDCTVGAGGHSCAIIQRHPELQFYVGMDIDPIAHERAKVRLDSLVNDELSQRPLGLKIVTQLRNFRHIKSVLQETDEQIVEKGADGILMDLGMSSMQVNDVERGFSVLNDGPLDMRMNPVASLKAEDILNSWPEDEVGRILRDYGEESNWHGIQKKIVKARLCGGLHSTGELVDLIRSSTRKSEGRQGWIKTATRVFQALRIAVNDELTTLNNALYSCFDCLSSGGRLAVISFHSLEDRIVKKTFLDIIGKEDDLGEIKPEIRIENVFGDDEETWCKKKITGRNGTILTKRPITPTEEEEKFNRRSRSAKLRVIEKA